jgi:hypothetical protein
VAASDNPAPPLLFAKPDQACRKSIARGQGIAGFRNASAPMPGGLCAGLEWSWIGGATFAQACNAASPFPSVGAGADSLIGSLVAGHTGDLIVDIDLTRIGPVSRTVPFGSDPPRSAPLRVAARSTAQTIAAEKIDRSRTEFPLCFGLSASVAELGPSTSRPTIQNPRMPCGCLALGRRRTRRNKRRKSVRSRAESVTVCPQLV